MERRTDAPELLGLVLAGGRSRRMGRDKGLIEREGMPQVQRAFTLLYGLLPSVRVSVRADQASLPPYAELPVVVDVGESAGPASGLIAAWTQRPGAALLVLAVDLVHVDAASIGRLIESRDAHAVATAFRHADGTPEPLCTIWEPAAREAIVARLDTDAADRGVSLRRVLEESRIRLVDAPQPGRLVSVNMPGDLA